MSRLPSLPVDKWDPELRAMTGADHASLFEQLSGGVLAHAPDMAKAMMRFAGMLWQGHTLPRRLLELMRLRIAFHNQCRSCMAVRYQSALDDGMTEEMVCSLEKPTDAPDLTPREKAALAYADLQATNHLAISDQTFADLRKHFTEAEIIELGMFASFYIGFGRFAAALDMVEELPDDFQDKATKATPWKRESIVLDDRVPA